MSVIIIGDVHGTEYWKNIVKEHKKSDDDMVIFLGDYVDSYDISPKKIYKNLIEIFSYAKNTPNVYMLIGNHDYQYMRHDIDRYSGYNYMYATKYYEVFHENYDMLNICIQLKINDSNVICTHAGVSNTFLKNNNITVDEINDLWKMKPSAFGFNHDTLDVYGNHPSQSPLWIRPQALFSDMVEGYSQVVGHTHFPKVRTERVNNATNDVLTLINTDDENGFIVK